MVFIYKYKVVYFLFQNIFVIIFFLNLLFINFYPFKETKYIDQELDHILYTYVILRHSAKKMEIF